MQLQRSYNRLRLYLVSHWIYEQTGMLGMQPELQYPRRSRFAPMKGLAFIGWDIRSYVKEQSIRTLHVITEIHVLMTRK